MADILRRCTSRETPHPVVGTLETEPTRVAAIYARRIDELVTDQAPRRLGIAIHSDEPPSHRELADFASSEWLSIVHLDDRGASAD